MELSGSCSVRLVSGKAPSDMFQRALEGFLARDWIQCHETDGDSLTSKNLSTFKYKPVSAQINGFLNYDVTSGGV